MQHRWRLHLVLSTLCKEVRKEKAVQKRGNRVCRPRPKAMVWQLFYASVRGLMGDCILDILDTLPPPLCPLHKLQSTKNIIPRATRP